MYPPTRTHSVRRHPALFVAPKTPLLARGAPGACSVRRHPALFVAPKTPLLARGAPGGGLVLALVVALAATQSLPASDWTRFRGPNGTGVSNDKGVPVKWTKENILWKTPIPGVGYGSPIVSKGKVFLQSAAQDGTSRSLICVDATSGKILWAQKMPGTKAHIHKLNSRASSTPASDGERVYSLFWDGSDITLFAHDFDGKLVWKHPLGRFTSQHGAGGSPIVHDGKLIFVNDQDGSSAVICLDAQTGKQIWKQVRKPFRACYSTPFIMPSSEGKTELVVATTAGITGYDLQSGQENWIFNWDFGKGMPLRTVGSPIRADGLILAASGDGSGARHTIAVRTGGKGDVSKTHLVWEMKKDFPYVPTMLVRGDYIYSVKDQGIAYCHVAKTGEQVWSERLGSTVFASPVMIDGKIYAAAENGTVYVFEAAPKFKLLAENSIGEPISATPAVVDNHLFVRAKSDLFCIGKK
jgi:outer membrane protein assembly factor BamB